MSQDKEDDRMSSVSMDGESLEDSDKGSSINSDIRDIITRLDLSEITVNDDESGISTGSSGASSPSISNAKDLGSEKADDIFVGEKVNPENGENNVEVDSIAPQECSPSGDTADTKLPDQKVKKKRGSIGGFFKRLSLSRESSKTSKLDSPPVKGSTVSLRVESLPQGFIAKCLGSRPCNGIWGAEHTRGPVDEMIAAVRTVLQKGGDLPLVKMQITEKGIDINEHKQNTGYSIETCKVPIEFISYGVQDSRYTRVFCFIVVKEMSWRAKKMECHAYVCDSSLSARKLSLSVALAFKMYSTSLQGKNLKFGIDLESQQETIPKESQQSDENEEFEA